ncbi:hypothetical protein HPB52_023999 [Rhipicephalus sanguineus]|uniref:Glucose-methanol-choline oxidoreductase N-terminal domain-containing protein n=1 Tax=Rhipicephalus sanguineus TaxID=34632 RepID=A0A9D4T296_RHISA|nr:hypothetical protein HPB52_023999 [Rhipicephalus sanguineus]
MLIGAVAASDLSRQRLKELLTTLHPDASVANGKGPKPLPEGGITKRECATLLRLSMVNRIPRGKVFSGSSSINHVIYARGNRKDYDNWVSVYGAEGWSYKDVLPDFISIETSYLGIDNELSQIKFIDCLQPSTWLCTIPSHPLYGVSVGKSVEAPVQVFRSA